MNTAVEPYKASSFDLTHKLTVEKHGHTALITINHPPANTWDRDSLIGLRQLIEHLNRDDDIYALVVTGQGPKFFSAGADLNMFADGDKARAREMARRFGEAFEALRDFRGVSIAAINGYAMGGGLVEQRPVLHAVAAGENEFGLGHGNPRRVHGHRAEVLDAWQVARHLLGHV
ncbi:enoyl-CoA hydratase-related protein, partial [Pseudomonas aeruginosa]